MWLDPPADGGLPDAAAIVAAADAHVAATGEDPIIVVAAGTGVFALGDDRRQADTARELYLDASRVGLGAVRLGGVRPLAPDERRFIEEWEAEAYRRGITPDLAAGSATGPMTRT